MASVHGAGAEIDVLYRLVRAPAAVRADKAVQDVYLGSGAVYGGH
jgi:hypothetical protein